MMKRPAATGASPARLSRTQSIATTRVKRSVAAALRPAAAATAARTASSSGAARKWMATCQRPPPASDRLTATSAAAKRSAMTSAIRCALCSSVSSRATTVAGGLGNVPETVVSEALVAFIRAIHRSGATAGRRLVACNICTDDLYVLHKLSTLKMTAFSTERVSAQPQRRHARRRGLTTAGRRLHIAELALARAICGRRSATGSSAVIMPSSRSITSRE